MRPGLAYLFLAMSSQEPTRRCARAVQLSPTWRVRSGNHNAPVTAALHHWCSLSEACIDAHRAMTWLRVFFSIPCPGGRYAAAQGTGAGVRACSRSHLRQRTVREMAVSTFVRASETTCRNARSAVICLSSHPGTPPQQHTGGQGSQGLSNRNAHVTRMCAISSAS